MVSMIERDLKETRPSRDAAFTEHLAELIEAVSAGDATRVRVLLELDPSLAQGQAAYLKTGLHWAAEKDFAEIARILLQAGADLNALTDWGMTPLEWAANMGNRGVGAVLIERGLQPNLFSAAGLGLLETVRAGFDSSGALLPGTMQLVLTDARASRHVHSNNAEDRPAALSFASYIAARNGHTALTRFLLERGADIDYRGFFGGTGLHWAAHNGHTETVELLLERGANVTLRDFEFDGTAQDWAAHGEHAALAQRLARESPTGQPTPTSEQG